jgi:hypothetical protein
VKKITIKSFRKRIHNSKVILLKRATHNVGPRLRRKRSKYIKRKGRLGQTLGVARGESSLNSPGTEECRDRTNVQK